MITIKQIDYRRYIYQNQSNPERKEQAAGYSGLRDCDKHYKKLLEVAGSFRRRFQNYCHIWGMSCRRRKIVLIRKNGF